MILAAPLVIPFAKAVGLSVGALGMAALADQVNEYIQANPEESMKILSTIIPGVGIGQIFMSKEDKISLEDLDEMTDEEAQDLSKEEKAELMKQAGKSGGPNKRQTMIDISEKLGLSGEGKEKQDIEYEIDERYDEGGVEEVSKPKFDYKKFFRKRRADGGAIGVESLFEEKVPAAPSQLVEESEIVLGYRGPGGYQGGRTSGVDRGPSARDRAMGSGGKQRGGTNTQPGGGGGGGGQTTTSTPTKNPFSKKNLQTHFANNQLLADAVKKGILTNKEYNILGGYDATQTLGLGPIDTGLASLSYNVAQSVLGNQPFSDILGDVARNVKGATNISPELQTKYENIIGQNLADGGRVGFNLGGLLTGQAKNIYDTMSAAGYFTEDEIRNAIIGAGYEIPGASQPETTAPNIIGSQINQGRDAGPTRPTSEIVTDFQESITNRQNKLNNPGKIASFIGDFIPQQRSIADMLASGQVDTRLTGGIPLGIGSMIGRMLPDKYYDMSLADQITTQAYMGYTDPNTNIGNKDPFGLNVRSAFGNYAEKAAEIVDTLEEKLSRRGELSKYDQARLDHYRNVTKTKQDAIADIGLINLAKQQQAEKDRIAKAATEAFYAAQGKSDPGDQSRAGASGRRPGSGGAGIATDSTGTSYDRGGREGFGYGLKDGGLATMFVEKR